MRLSQRQFNDLVQQALERVPEPFADHLRNVVIEIRPAPSPRECRDVGIDDPSDILGLYQGTPLTERSVEGGPSLPDRITIYQRNIERICRSREEIVEQVRATVLHEVGHFFGLDEDELEALGY